MKILIVNGYVRKNKGDAALMSVLIRQLQQTFPKAFIVIAGMEDPKQYPNFEGFKNVGSMRLYAAREDISRIHRIFRKFFVSIIGIIWPVCPLRSILIKILPFGIRKELSAIQNADLVVSLGGGYLNGSNTVRGNLNIYYLTLPLRLAERLHKVVIMAPQSFGPLGNNWQRRLVLKTLNSSKLICVREDPSYDFLKTIGVKQNLIIRTVDSGFAHITYSKGNTSSIEKQLRIGITARNWLKAEQQTYYESSLADFIVDLEKTYHAEVILIPQVTSSYQDDDDRIVEKRIRDLAFHKGAHPIQIIEEISHDDIVKLYSTLTFTIGTRFHSVIFSLINYVPAIAIEYEYKTSGIMYDLGLSEWVIKIEEVNFQKLKTLFSNLIVKKDPYNGHLMTVLPTYIEKTKDVPRLIKHVYEKYADGKVV